MGRGNIWITQTVTFINYLSSIGLSNHNATEKLALQRLRDELLSRQWMQ